ncbi:hypothetical protein HKCCE2091_09630 [Rhodobacterales bacterium HKCCE2091]|nr:hypothetical protein [Rhodobacterales bacterium HKCCE2091]
MGFLLRWLFAFILLAVTYNPSEWNYVRWVSENWETRTSLAVLFGLILVIAYVLFFTAVLRGIGTFGAILVLALVAAVVWVMFDFGWIDLDNPSTNTWIALVALSVVLAIGMYWGIMWRRMSGQLEVDDEEE